MNTTILPAKSAYHLADIEIQRNSDTLIIQNEALSRKIDLTQSIPRTTSLTTRLKAREYVTPDQTRGDFSFMGYNMPDSRYATEYQCRSVEIEERRESLFDGRGLTIRIHIEEAIQQLTFVREYYIYPRLPVIATRCGIKAAVSPNRFWSPRSASFDKGDFTQVEQESRMESLRLVSELDSFKVVNFSGRTDFSDDLVSERVLSGANWTARGNIIFSWKSGSNGLFVLQEAPPSDERRDLEDCDFRFGESVLQSCCWGICPHEVRPEEVRYGYRHVIGLYDGNEWQGVRVLKDYLRTRFPQAAKESEVIMINPWGSGSFSKDISESHLINEIAAASKIGATHYEIDDGWQHGLSLSELHLNNRAAGNDFWQISKFHFPNGFTAICAAAARHDIQLALWLAPSFNQEFRDWRRFVDMLSGFYRNYQIRTFKIDGVMMRTKEAEENLENMLRELRTLSDGDIVFDIDITAGQRSGYFLFLEYGKLFLENRYACHPWGRVYHPEKVLRTFWQLSKYIRPQILQIEATDYLNLDRRYYDQRGVSHPDAYPLPYWMAVTLFANPLLWLAPSKLDEGTRAIYQEALQLRKLYGRQIFAGEIFPVGDEPNGGSLTGFQSHRFETGAGFLIIFRELGAPPRGVVQMRFVEDCFLLLQSLTDNSPAIEKLQGNDLEVTLDTPASFRLFRYGRLEPTTDHPQS